MNKVPNWSWIKFIEYWGLNNLIGQKNTLILKQTKEEMQLIVLKKIFLKLMNNSVFCKTMENLRKRISVKLIINAKGYVKCISKPSFISQRIFSKTFVAIHKKKQF